MKKADMKFFLLLAFLLTALPLSLHSQFVVKVGDDSEQAHLDDVRKQERKPADRHVQKAKKTRTDASGKRADAEARDEIPDASSDDEDAWSDAESDSNSETRSVDSASSGRKKTVRRSASDAEETDSYDDESADGWGDEESAYDSADSGDDSDAEDDSGNETEEETSYDDSDAEDDSDRGSRSAKKRKQVRDRSVDSDESDSGDDEEIDDGSDDDSQDDAEDESAETPRRKRRGAPDKDRKEAASDEADLEKLPPKARMRIRIRDTQKEIARLKVLLGKYKKQSDEKAKEVPYVSRKFKTVDQKKYDRRKKEYETVYPKYYAICWSKDPFPELTETRIETDSETFTKYVLAEWDARNPEHRKIGKKYTELRFPETFYPMADYKPNDEYSYEYVYVLLVEDCSRQKISDFYKDNVLVPLQKRIRQLELQLLKMKDRYNRM